MRKPFGEIRTVFYLQETSLNFPAKQDSFLDKSEPDTLYCSAPCAVLETVWSAFFTGGREIRMTVSTPSASK